jgi:hypothetical protein
MHQGGASSAAQQLAEEPWERLLEYELPYLLAAVEYVHWTIAAHFSQTEPG